MMKIAFGIVLLVACTVAGGKPNLPANAQIRIGVKHMPQKCDGKVQPGDKLTMHYKGWLRTTEEVFDATGDSPFQFTNGAGDVVKGWDIGTNGMCIGEKRRLTIPSGLAYGGGGAGDVIPGGATLVFDVELVHFERAASAAIHRKFGTGKGEQREGEL